MINSFFALISSVPKIIELIDFFVNQWISYKVSQVEKKHTDKIEARNGILIEMQKAKDAKDSNQLRRLNVALAFVELHGADNKTA